MFLLIDDLRCCMMKKKESIFPSSENDRELSRDFPFAQRGSLMCY